MYNITCNSEKSFYMRLVMHLSSHLWVDTLRCFAFLNTASTSSDSVQDKTKLSCEQQNHPSQYHNVDDFFGITYEPCATLVGLSTFSVHCFAFMTIFL